MKMELMQNIAKVEANAESANKALSARLDDCIDVSNQLKSTMDSNHSEIMAFLMNKSKPSARDETPNQAHSSTSRTHLLIITTAYLRNLLTMTCLLVVQMQLHAFIKILPLLVVAVKVAHHLIIL